MNSLNILNTKPTILNICNLPFLRPPDIGKIRVKFCPKPSYFYYFQGFCTNRIAVFNSFLSLISSQPRDKLNRARFFFLFKYFLNNKLIAVFMQNARFQNSSSYCKKNSVTRYYSFMQQSVRNVCAKLKVDRFSRSRFHNRAR